MSFISFLITFIFPFFISPGALHNHHRFEMIKVNGCTFTMGGTDQGCL